MCILCALVSVNVNAQFNSAPAFPGAEGYGRYTTGGRGGVIRHVTNLNDSGTGSFRAAVNGSSKKIVVFDVGGVIELASDLEIGANTTILGQTAPGDGITLRYYTVKYASGGNIIMRYMRIRRGQEKDVNDGADATWTKGRSNIILDHCSFSWSIDEVASFYDNKDFTMQWCTIGEPLKYSGHEKGPHGYGGIWGGKGASFHHNLLIHLDNRAPRLDGARFFWKGPNGTEYPDVESCIAAEKVDLRNCVIYNTGTGNGAYGGMGGNHNIVNNYYKAGPATKNTKRVFQCSVSNSTDGTGTKDANFPGGIWGKFYISGNYVTAAGSSAANYDWSGVTIDACKDNNVTTPTKDQLKISEVEKGSITTHSAEVAYERVLSYAGASKVKDCIDTRYEREVRNNDPECIGSATSYKDDKGTHSLSSSDHPKGIIDVTADALVPHGGVYTLDGGTKATDTDNDGIPDEWEEAHGLNKADAADALTYTLDKNNYYQNIEVYANYLVQDITKAERAGATDSFEEYYPLDSDDPAPTPTQTVISASQESVSITGTANATVTLSSNNASGAYSITQPNASVATASISGNTITITGVAAGSTSLTVTQAASTGYTSATKEISITVTAAQGGGDTPVAGTLTWDYSSAAPTGISSGQTTNTDNGLTYNGTVNDLDKNQLKGIKLNSSGYCYFTKGAVAGTLAITFGPRSGTNEASIKVYSYATTPSAETLIGTTETTTSLNTKTIALSATQNNIYLTRGASTETVITKIVFTPTPTTYTVSASATNGSVVIKNGSTTVASGTAVEDGTSLTFTATPTDGYKFTQWNDGNTDNPRTVVVNGANVSLTAEFEEEAGETTLFSLEVTSSSTLSLAYQASSSLAGYATIEGGSATVYNGKNSETAQNMVSSKAVNLGGSSGSYLHITLANGKTFTAGDVITITNTGNWNVSTSESNTKTKIETPYTIKNTDAFVNGSDLYIFKTGTSGDPSTIKSITITRGSNGGDTPDDGGDDDVIEDPDPAPVAVKPAAKKGFDFVVGHDGDINEAIAAANGASGSDRYLIFVPDGTHNLTATQSWTLGSDKSAITGFDGTTVQPGSTISNNATWLERSNVSIIGQSMDKTKLQNKPNFPGISYTSTLEIRGGKTNTYIQDLTLYNNYANGANNKGVAVAFYDRGTNTIAKNLNAWSNQDTYVSAATRCYYETSTFAGTVDFICGSGDVWFEKCDLVINDRSGNVITAPRTTAEEKWGFVFNRNTISKADGATNVTNGNWNLGRPWGAAPASTFLYTKMNVLPRDAGWTNMSNGLAIRFHEYGSTNSSGTLLDLSSRSVSDCAGAKADEPVLTEAQASKYKVSSVVGGTDNWDPRALALQVGVNNVTLTGNTLSWDDNDYALCWVVFKDGAYYANPITNSVTLTESGTYTVRAANSMGGLGEESEGKEYVDDRNGETNATVKMTYVDYNNPTTSYGEVTEAYSGYNKISSNNIVALAYASWNKNWITYIQVDASNIPAGRFIKKATLTAKVSGSNDSKRKTIWGVGYNTSTWSSDMTYDTADRTITTCGTTYTTTTSSATTFETVEFDITAALKYDEDNIATIIVYETAADGGKIKDVSALIEYTDEPPYELLSEDNDYTSFTEGTYTVKLKKTFPEGTWTSLVLPFSATTAQLMEAFPNNAENTEVAVVKEMRDNRVYFVTQAHIDANSPVLIKVGDVRKDNTYTFTNVTVKNSTPNTAMTSGIQMKGIYKRTTYLEEPLISDRQHLYFIYEGRFYDWSYLSHMSPFSAYIYTEANNAVAGAKPLIFMIDGETTGIRDVKTNDTDGAEYNSVGQRISKSAKGIHIKNGKKYFVK